MNEEKMKFSLIVTDGNEEDEANLHVSAENMSLDDVITFLSATLYQMSKDFDCPSMAALSDFHSKYIELMIDKEGE